MYLYENLFSKLIILITFKKNLTTVVWLFSTKDIARLTLGKNKFWFEKLKNLLSKSVEKLGI